MFDDEHAQIQPFVTIHKRRFCRWVPSACQLLRQTAFKGHLSPFLFSSSSSDLHPASSPAVTLSRLLVIQKSWTTHHCACEVKFCFAQTMNWKCVVTLADAQINVTPSKFNIFRIFQPHCTSVDVSDYVFSMHFNAVRCVSMAKLTVIFELPAIFKVFIFPSLQGEYKGKEKSRFLGQKNLYCFFLSSI